MKYTKQEANIWTVEQWSEIKKVIQASQFDYRVDFIKWLSENPHIWKAFVTKTEEAHEHRHKQRFSSRAIIEILRWETMLQQHDVTFKISNSFCADLARLLMDCKPSMKGYFRTCNSSLRNDSGAA